MPSYTEVDEIIETSKPTSPKKKGRKQVVEIDEIQIKEEVSNASNDNDNKLGIKKPAVATQVVTKTLLVPSEKFIET